MNITLRQLSTFREVMRCRSVSDAARAIGRTQPSVSSAISNLEAELGFDLFQRQKGRMVPTPEAHYLLEEANQVIGRMAQTVRTMSEIGNLDRGQLKIACMPAASGFLMPREISEFVKNRPDVNVSLMMRSSAVIEELIASQQYDIGLSETRPARGTIRSQDFMMRCVCAVAVNDPLARHTGVTPGDLNGRPMAALFDEHPISVETRAAFDAAGSVFNRRFELQTYLPALDLVEHGNCCAICDPISASSYHIYRNGNLGIKFVPFSPGISFSISILTPAQRPLSRLANAFAGQLARMIEGMSD